MEYRKKLIKIAKMMNMMSDKKIRLIKPVIDCFEAVISDIEADVLMEVGINGITHQELKSRVKMENEKSFDSIAHGLARKGMIWVDYQRKDRFYNLAPILPGWFEVNLMKSDLDHEQKYFAKKLDYLLNINVKLNVQPIRALFNMRAKIVGKNLSSYSILTIDSKSPKRRIQINKKVQTQVNEVILTSTAQNLINELDNNYPIGLVQCFCRVIRQQKNESCQFNMPNEACIVVGDLALQIEEFGIGRRINKEEAVNIVNICQDKGAIHTAFHVRDNTDNPVFAICNCCWDCCVMYGGLNRGGLLSLNYKSYFIVQIQNKENCSKCGICQKFCPTEAIKVDNLGVSIKADRCIGCGQCAVKCGREVLVMAQEERNVLILSNRKKKRKL